MDEHSDEQLISDYLAGDTKALEILIHRYLKPIYGYSLKYLRNATDADDATQETFVKMWRGLNKFESTKKLRPWLYAIARNTALDSLRKRKTATWPLSALALEQFNTDFEETIADAKPLITEVLADKEDSAALQRATSKLSKKYQLILNLRYDCDLTFAEIAEELDKSIDTVKSQHRRALILLKKYYKK
ncbi:MAG: sigma-70 family RNA polymerase sigma factor [Parcubacteria group bacterium]